MHAHALPPRDRYQLRNDAKATFELRSSAVGSGAEGCVVKVAVTRFDGHKFPLRNRILWGICRQ
jgi:hypothetical protein